MKLTRRSGRPVAIAVTVACTIIACQGDDSSEPPDAGRGGGAGTSDATGSGGGTGGQADEGGQSDAAGQGGASGQGGTAVSDSGPDVSAGGGGSAASDASDANAIADRREGAVSDAAPEADAGEGRVCPAPPDGGFHVQLYSFDFVDGGATGIGDWSTYAPPGVTSSVDDFSGESAATPGAIHAQITFPFGGYGSKQVFERGAFSTPLDFSCFTRMHMWIKITSPASSFLSVQAYAVHSDNPFDGVFGTYYSGASLDALADGNWHELVTTLSGTTPRSPNTALRSIPSPRHRPTRARAPTGERRCHPQWMSYSTTSGSSSHSRRHRTKTLRRARRWKLLPDECDE